MCIRDRVTPKGETEQTPEERLLRAIFGEKAREVQMCIRDRRGTVVPVDITIYEDRSFTFELKTPPTPVLLRQAAGISKGSSTTGRDSAGTVTDAQLADIAKIKLPDLNTDDLEQAKLQVAGTARSMGIKVSG